MTPGGQSGLLGASRENPSVQPARETLSFRTPLSLETQ